MPPNVPPTPGANAPKRTIMCYHCRHRFEVPVRAMSTSCPKCYKGLVIEDVVIKTAHAVRKVQTCGKVLVEAKGRLIATSVEAAQGVEVLGVLEGSVTSGGPVRIGPSAQWKGDLKAPSLRVELGARITRGYFVIPDDSLTPKDEPEPPAASSPTGVKTGNAPEAGKPPRPSPGASAGTRPTGPPEEPEEDEDRLL